MVRHNDEPVLIDELDRGSFVTEIGDAIAECTPPQVFGVHGDWGLGKTSLLHQLQWHLSGTCQQQTEEAREQAKSDRNAPIPRDDKDNFVIVWFEAWRYQNEPVPILALLHEMRAQMDWWVKVGNKLDEKTSVALHGALHSIEELTKKIGIQASKFYDSQIKWERDNLTAQLPSNTLSSHLEEAIGLLLKRGALRAKSKRRLVILIDDLDRCEPESAFRLLEGIKIYLGLKNCIFVLGMNQKVIEDAIAHNLSIDDAIKKQIRAESYLEKLCQNVWRLPAVGETKRKLCNWLSVDGGFRRRIESALGVLPCLPPNPRRLKGLANLLTRLSERLPEVTEDEDENMQNTKILIVVAYVYQFHHNLFVRWEASPDFYRDILEWTRSPYLDTQIEEGDDPAPQKENPFFGLIPAYKSETDESSATASHTLTSLHPDPTASNVFWMQPLIVELGDNVDGSDFERYMRANHDG